MCSRSGKRVRKKEIYRPTLKADYIYKSLVENFIYKTLGNRHVFMIFLQQLMLGHNLFGSRCLEHVPTFQIDFVVLSQSNTKFQNVENLLDFNSSSIKPTNGNLPKKLVTKL